MADERYTRDAVFHRECDAARCIKHAIRQLVRPVVVQPKAGDAVLLQLLGRGKKSAWRSVETTARAANLDRAEVVRFDCVFQSGTI